MTDSSAIATHHRCASDLEAKSSFPLLEKVSSGHSGTEVNNPLSSATDPVSSKSTSASDRSGLRPQTIGADDPQALDLWQGAEHSPVNEGQKTPPEVSGDLERQTPPSGNEGRVTTGSGRKKQTKEGGDAAADGGTGQETSYSSCLEGSSSSSQATWWSVTDGSLSATDQEKKRVSFGDCSIPCEPEKRSILHKRSILKTTGPSHADSSAAVAEGEGGGEGRDVEKTGARHGRLGERDLEADKIVNSAALTKKRLRKRSTNSPSHHRQSPVLLILSGHFSTPRRNQSAGVATAREADTVGRRKGELPASAPGCRPGYPTDVYLSGSRRGHRPQTPPPQRRRRCQSSGGIVNQSYKEDEEDREDGEEADNKRNAERLGGRGRAGPGGGGLKEEEQIKQEDGSTCYLVHLRDTDRIPKHVDHIIRKFNLRLLEPQNTSRNNNIVDVETASAAMTTGRAPMKPQQQPQQQQPMAANITPKKKESEEKLQNSSSSSCLEQETSKNRSLSLRRRLSLRFSKKTGSLDKSKSVPGPSTVGQGGGGGGGSSREETLTGPGSIKHSTTSGVEESKDTESCGAAGSSEDQSKTSGSVSSDATYRAQKKAPRWRKLSLHIFRKSRDRVTEEAPQPLQPQQEKSKEREESSDTSSRDKNDGTLMAQQPPPPAETSEGTSVGLMVTNSKRTSSETSKEIISCAQQKTRSPPTCQDPMTEAETMMARSAETRTGAKTESNRELAIQQRSTSQSPWTTTMMTPTQTSSSDVIVPLVAKTSLVFEDAVFYFPSQQKDDDDDGARDGVKGTLTAAAAVKSEGKVPKPSKSSSLRLPLKGAISETRDEHELRQRRGPNHLERRRSSLLLKRIRAFFGRSSGSAEEQEAEERRMTTEELQLLTKPDIEMETQHKTSSSLLPLHPTVPAPPHHQLNESVPLLQAESFDPAPPPPPPHKHLSTLSFARRQSSSENQLPVSANRRSLDPFVAEGRERSGKEDENNRRRREEQSVE